MEWKTWARSSATVPTADTQINKPLLAASQEMLEQEGGRRIYLLGLLMQVVLE
jgi:hypothetical protein